MSDLPRQEADSWDRVRDYLTGCLLSLSARGKAHVRDLEATSKGKLLATCLAIDLAAESLSADAVTALFEGIPDNDADICTKVADYLKDENSRKFICSSCQQSPQPEPSDTYVSVMEIWSFIRRYVMPNTGEGIGPEEVEKVLDTYFRGDADLSGIMKADLSPSHRLFVLPKSEYTQLLTLRRGKSPAVFLDALGLNLKRGWGTNGLPYLVAVVHAPEADYAAKQPTSFDAWWGDTHVQFISFGKEDGWGRTHSCSGQKYIKREPDGMPRERVHGHESGLLGCIGEEIGSAAPVPTIAQEEVFQAALKRFLRIHWRADAAAGKA